MFNNRPPPPAAPAILRIKFQCFAVALRSLPTSRTPGPTVLPQLCWLVYGVSDKLVLLSGPLKLLLSCVENSSSRSSQLATSWYSDLSTDASYSEQLFLTIPATVLPPSPQGILLYQSTLLYFSYSSHGRVK